jgi:hypothetical protein
MPANVQHHLEPHYSLPGLQHVFTRIPPQSIDTASIGLPDVHPSETQVFRPLDFSNFPLDFNTIHHMPSDIVPIAYPVFSTTTNPLAIARQYVFSRGLKFGLRFTSAKTQALLNGDLSHALVHPAIVHATTLWGLLMTAHSRGHHMDATLQAGYYRAAYASLRIPPTTRESAVDDVQARSILALYDFNSLNIVAGDKWLREAVGTARQAGLSITLPSRMCGVRDDVALYVAATAEDQERDALCTLAYVDTGKRILVNTESRFDEELQRSLTQLLVSVLFVDNIQ